MSEIKKPKYAYIHSCHVESNIDNRNDAIVVKRYKILPDGTRVPQVGIHENFERSFWITKPANRTHEGKLEYEYLNRVKEFKSTQRLLTKRIQQKLEVPVRNNVQLRELCNNPYVYGADKDINCILADAYKTHFKDIEPFDLTVGCMDTETNVVNGSNDLIIMTFYFGNKAVVAIHEEWETDTRETEETYKEFITENLPEVKERNIDVEVVFCETPAQCILTCLNRAHEWMPDIIGFWNIDFDMPKIMETLKKENYNLAEVFSHPTVPEKYKHFHYKRGMTEKIMDSGKSMPLQFSQQWHTVLTPASFYFIDPGATYRCLRRQKSEPSYGLDFITKKEVGSGKYKPKLPLIVEQRVKEGSLKWHTIMQKHYKKHYAAYALGDVIQPVKMDEHTGDLSKKLPILSMGSHFKDFNSNPRKLCDQLHNFFLQNGAVVGTTGSRMESPIDKFIPASKDWIVTLEAPLIENLGLHILCTAYNEGGETKLKEVFAKSKIFIHNADLDIVSTYPILGMLFNIARETAIFETCKIEGLDYYQYREFGIDLTAGVANAVLIGEQVLGLKGFEAVIDDFEKAHNLPSSKEKVERRFQNKLDEQKEEAKRKARESLAMMQ